MHEFMELYRCVVPAAKIINDNHGQHYRTHQGNLDWLTNQFNEILAGQRDTVVGYGRGAKHVMESVSGPCGFAVPGKESVISFLGKGSFKLRCEVWRPREIRFDPQNYAKTFKAPIDLLVSNGYIPDDSWKFVSGIEYCGGGASMWGKRAWRYGNDGLPDDVTPEWWFTVAEDYGDIMLRILAYPFVE
jgi:hypothetical protein